MQHAWNAPQPVPSEVLIAMMEVVDAVGSISMQTMEMLVVIIKDLMLKTCINVK